MRIFWLLFALSTQAQAVEKTTVRTSYGAEIPVEINRAAQPGPAVVIAPGAGYHMDLPLIQELAEALAARGFTAYRFNWNYFARDPENGNPSRDRELEIRDMQAVVALAKKDRSVTKVFAAGKSLGTYVSYRVFQRDVSLQGLALLTPLCTSLYDENDQPRPAPIPSGAKNYPGLLTIGRPVALATSDRDPNCDLAMLRDFLGNSSIPVNVVGGDHSWDVTKGTDDASKAQNAANRRRGIDFVVGWLSGL